MKANETTCKMISIGSPRQDVEDSGRPRQDAE